MNMLIPNMFHISLNSEQFFRATLTENIRNNEQCCLIFASDDFFRLLIHGKRVFVDATFKSVPKPFDQLFTMHVLIGDRLIPCLFAYMSSKHKEMYIKIFQFLNIWADHYELEIEWNKQINSETILLCDYESSIILAVKEVFSFIEIKGCFFHLTQAIFRKMRSYPELRLKYKDRNDNFKKFIRRIQYINFLQIDVIVDIFNELVIEREIEEDTMILFYN